MVFHDLTRGRTCPRDCKQLLGLGSKFVVKPGKTSSESDIIKSFERFERDIKVKSFFAGGPRIFDDEENGPSKLYVKSEWIPPRESLPKEFYRRLEAFRAQLLPSFTARVCETNLSPPQMRLLRSFMEDHDIITVNTDKGLGIGRIEYDQYVIDAFENHFNDTATYECISSAEADADAIRITSCINEWLVEYGDVIGKSKVDYISSHLDKCRHPFPFFYQLYKIHKKPLKTRPVISGCGSLLHPLGHWIDEQLQPVARSMPSYFRSSYVLKEELLALRLPPNAVLFTADATSMYTNIDTTHALAIIGDYIDEHEGEFPHLEPEPLKKALELVMRNMICVFGDLYFRQKKGTAMGTPPAPPWATVYYGLHEKNILPLYSDVLEYYRRFIDDIFGIWLTDPDPEIDEIVWTMYKSSANDGGLEWVFTERGKRVDFMDLTITIVGDRIETTLFEKELALYQYIPPASTHPPGLLNGLIIGQVLRFHQLCTSEADVHDKMRLLHRRLIQRGYKKEVLFPYFQQGLAAAREFLALPLEQRIASKKLTGPDPSLIFFHLKFHPEDVTSQFIQAIWRETVMEPTDRQPFYELTNESFGAPLGINRAIVAYSRHLNIGNMLSIRRFDRLKGPSVSSFNLHN